MLKVYRVESKKKIFVYDAYSVDDAYENVLRTGMYEWMWRKLSWWGKKYYKKHPIEFFVDMKQYAEDRHLPYIMIEFEPDKIGKVPSMEIVNGMLDTWDGNIDCNLIEKGL